jgi:hypothetical protein
MSNTLAIATVSATLQQLLLAGVSADFPGATVTLGEPKAASASPSPQVNICMYQISPNMGYRNYDLPAKDSAGKWVNQPKLGIDLYYLFTFYGNEQQLEPQRLLGDVLSTLHTQPILTKDLITATINQPLYSFLATSDLANEAVEQVKLIPQSNPREEVAKLWRDYFQTIPYSLSLAYQASVVLIDSTETLKPQVPVETVVINAFPVQSPASRVLATGLKLDLIKAPGDKVSGSVTIHRARDERQVKTYNLYWGSNATTKLKYSPMIAAVRKTGGNIVFPLSPPIDIPSHATHVLVFVNTGTAEVDSGISAAIPPLNLAQAVKIDMSITAENTIAGTITVAPAIDDHDISQYVLYWASDANTLLANTAPIARLSKTGSLTYTLPLNTTLPKGAHYILTLTANAQATMTYGVSAIIPPLYTAAGVTLNLHENNSGLAGDIHITKAVIEDLIDEYRLYWSADGINKLSATSQPFVKLAKTGTDLTYTLPATTPPTNTAYILVLTANSVEMAQGIGATLGPRHKANAIQLNLLKSSGNNVSGSITITKADDESDIARYNLYWGNSSNSKLSNTAFISLPKTGHDLVIQLSPPTPRPSGANYVLGFTGNSFAEMIDNTPAGIPPLNKALALTLNVSKNDENKLTGTISITKAPDESDITYYRLYWGIDGNTKLANSEAFKTLPKTGSDLIYQLTDDDNLIVPSGANFILAITGNEQAEMSYGTGSSLP